MSVLERQLGQVWPWVPERTWRSARVLEPASSWVEWDVAVGATVAVGAGA